MSLVNILNVEVLDNPAPFFNPIQLEITFECIQALEDDLEWKVIYVGSASSEEYDQVLDSVMVGPVPVGINKFVFQTDPPNPAKIPAQDAIGATVLLLTCSYLSREFIRVGYYVNNDYTQEFLRPIHQAQLEQLQASGEQIDLANPPAVVYPAEPQFEHMVRSILADKPRVTRFPISWVKGQDTEMLEVPIVEGNPDEEPAEIEIRAGHVVSADGIQASSGSGVSPAAEQMIV